MNIKNIRKIFRKIFFQSSCILSIQYKIFIRSPLRIGNFKIFLTQIVLDNDFEIHY